MLNRKYSITITNVVMHPILARYSKIMSPLLWNARLRRADKTLVESLDPKTINSRKNLWILLYADSAACRVSNWGNYQLRTNFMRILHMKWMFDMTEDNPIKNCYIRMHPSNFLNKCRLLENRHRLGYPVRTDKLFSVKRANWWMAECMQQVDVLPPWWRRC